MERVTKSLKLRNLWGRDYNFTKFCGNHVYSIHFSFSRSKCSKSLYEWFSIHGQSWNGCDILLIELSLVNAKSTTANQSKVYSSFTNVKIFLSLLLSFIGLHVHSNLFTSMLIFLDQKSIWKDRFCNLWWQSFLNLDY